MIEFFVSYCVNTLVHSILMQSFDDRDVMLISTNAAKGSTGRNDEQPATEPRSS